MIASLRGILIDREEDRVVVEAGGVGYEVFCTEETLIALPAIGEEVFLHIQADIREDAFNLYGFLRPGDKRMFCLLTGVTGVGPKLALAILSHIRPAELAGLLATGDTGRLVKVPGIGKKTAERLCLELKDKVQDIAVGQVVPTGPPPAASPVLADAVSALVNLGYPEASARAALEHVRVSVGDDSFVGLGLEELIRRALRSLA